VNESLGPDPTEVLDPLSELQVRDTLDDDIDEPATGQSELTPRREGLPPGFRTRHDKHYVDELISGPTRVDDRRTAAAAHVSAATMEMVASRLESILAHDAITRGRVAAPDLVGRSVQAELQKVSRFARAVALSARQPHPVRRSVTAGEIVTAVRSACTPVARLNGVLFLVTTDDDGFAVAVERQLVVQALAGTVDALLDLMLVDTTEDSVDQGASMTVSLQAAKARPALIVDVECPTLVWRAASADRFLENSGDDFAAAPAAGILLASAARVVRAHGGRAEARLQGGVTVRYVLPNDALRGAGSC
jgi:hypothetical protein